MAVPGFPYLKKNQTSENNYLSLKETPARWLAMVVLGQGDHSTARRCVDMTMLLQFPRNRSKHLRRIISSVQRHLNLQPSHSPLMYPVPRCQIYDCLLLAACWLGLRW